MIKKAKVTLANTSNPSQHFDQIARTSCCYIKNFVSKSDTASLRR